MAWYRFNQNNTGGKWQGPAMIVGVEAESVADALYIAPRFGLYFNGCDAGLDCKCCGDRWYEPQEYAREDIRGYFDSNQFGLRDQSIKWAQRNNIAMVALYAADGSTEIVTPQNYEVQS